MWSCPPHMHLWQSGQLRLPLKQLSLISLVRIQLGVQVLWCASVHHNILRKLNKMTPCLASTPSVAIGCRREGLEVPSRKCFQFAPLVQLAEHLTLNQYVPGSSPGWCTTILRMTTSGRRECGLVTFTIPSPGPKRALQDICPYIVTAF